MFTTYTFKPQLKLLGAKYGKQLGEIRTALAEVDGAKAMAELKSAGVMTLKLADTEIKLTEEELLIDVSQKEGYAVSSDRGVTVVLDVNLTPELIEEGFVREIISKVQSMRKDAGFEVMDHIRIYCSGNDKIAQVLEANKVQIGNDTLADDFIIGSVGGSTAEWDINGEKVTLGVEKL